MFLFNYSTLIDPLLHDVRIYTSRFSGMKNGDKVLDICCGTGDQAFHYAKMGIEATGVDLNPEMIKVAERRKEKCSFNNISFQLADAKELPFEDASFDYASISFGLHETGRDSREKIISEMRRVVRKEGFLIFIDFRVPLPKNIYSYIVRAIEYFAGRDHYKYFKDYLLQGGLPILLRKNKLKEGKRGYIQESILKDIVTIIKAKNI